MRKRDPERTRAHILNVAFMEIYRRGFHAVGVREIAEKAGVTIGAFFHHFPTKNLVGYAIIDEVLRAGIMARWITPLATEKNPLKGILKCFKKTFDEWPDEFVPLGCPLNNLTQEMSAVDPAFKEKTSKLLSDWIDATEDHLRRAHDEGFLAKNANVREMAVFIVTLQEGTFAMGKALNNRKIFEPLYRSLKTYLDSKSA